jgi:Xaa-Pro aminopeptidase
MAGKLTAPILLVGTPIYHADLAYATRFSAPDPVVFLRTGRHAFLVVNQMERARAQKTVQGIQVMTPDELSLKPEDRHRYAGWTLGLLRKCRIRSVRVAADFPLGIARYLESHGCRVVLDESPLFPERSVKSAREIRFITQAQQAAVAGLAVAQIAIQTARADHRGILILDRKPLTSERMRKLIHTALLDFDCLGTETIVAGGRSSADPHQVGHGALRTGEPIVIDIFPRHIPSGYWGDITRTMWHGKPAPALIRMFDAVRAAQLAVLEKVRPGVQTRTLHQEAIRILAEHGFVTRKVNGRAEGFIHGTGHGVGLQIHEAPSLGGGSDRLKVGQVITVEPGLYYPTRGGVRIEDTVVVTPKGCKILANYPYFRAAPRKKTIKQC